MGRRTNTVSRDSTQKEVSVILPTYNEKDNIGPLIQEIFSNTAKDTEVIVIDDDSPDETWRVVEELAENQDNIHLFRRIGKRGLVSALVDGIDISKGDIIVWMDCDFSMPPQNIKELLNAIDKGYDVAVGSRFVKGGGVEIIKGSGDTYWAYLMSLSLNLFIQKTLGSSFKDYTSGFIAIKKKILEKISLKGDYGEYFIDLIYRAIKMGYKVKEIPYLNKARRSGVSKTGTNPFHHLKKGIKYILVTLKLKLTKIEKEKNKNG